MKSFFSAPPVGGGRSRKTNDPPLGALRCRRRSSECEIPPLGIGIQAIRLSPYRAGLAGRHLQRLPVSPAFLACSFPLRLSPSGQPDDPGASLRAPPDCVRDSTPRPAAHTFTAHGSPVVDVLSDDGRGHLGVPHVAYLHAPTIRPPAPLRHVAGSPDRGLLWGLR